MLDDRQIANEPAVAVDSAGTAHIVWDEDHSIDEGDLVHYCQVPRNASACSVKHVLHAPLNQANTDVLLPGGDTVLVLSTRCCTSGDPGHPIYVFTSNDHGATFSAYQQIVKYFMEEAEFGLVMAVSTITHGTTGGVRYQAAPLSGEVVGGARVGEKEGNSLGVYNDGSIAFVDAFTPIVAMADDTNVFFRRFGGATSTTTSPRGAP